MDDEERVWMVAIQGAECGPMTLSQLWAFIDCHFAGLAPGQTLGLAVRRLGTRRVWPCVACRQEWRTIAPDPETWRWSLMI